MIVVNLKALVECAPYVARGDIDIEILRAAFKLTSSEMILFRDMVETCERLPEPFRLDARAPLGKRDAFTTSIDGPSVIKDPPTAWPTLKDL